LHFPFLLIGGDAIVKRFLILGLVVLMSIPLTLGCGGERDKNSNREKDKPKPVANR